jgi:hypothetical protein
MYTVQPSGERGQLEAGGSGPGHLLGRILPYSLCGVHAQGKLPLIPGLTDQLLFMQIRFPHFLASLD